MNDSLLLFYSSQRGTKCEFWSFETGLLSDHPRTCTLKIKHNSTKPYFSNIYFYIYIAVTFVIPPKVFAPLFTFRRVYFPFFVLFCFCFSKKIIIKDRKKEGKQEESKTKKSRKRRLEAHQLWGNLEPVETADTSLPVEWTHLFYMLSNWHCPSRFEWSL